MLWKNALSICSRQQNSATGIFSTCALVLIATFLCFTAAAKGASNGPLTVPADNPRYFVNASGKSVLLAGSYLGHETLELGLKDFTSYLDSLQQQKHNFTRLWAWEQSPTVGKSALLTLPYERTGPGVALDGGFKFDLRRLNQAYFDQLRSRVAAAAERGIYVSVVLFQSLSAPAKNNQSNPWQANPLNRANNINGINGDTNSDGVGDEAFNLSIPTVTTLQETYARKVVDTLYDLDNVLYEVSGDGALGTLAWQNHIVQHLKSYEATKSVRHPVGMSYFAGVTSNDIFFGPADWINYAQAPIEPSLISSNKVLVYDPNPQLLRDWSAPQSLWEGFTRGYQLLTKELDSLPAGMAENLHLTTTQIAAYGDFLALSGMTPNDRICSTGYCLVNAGVEYLIYLPRGGRVSVDLSTASGNFSARWFSPASGQTIAGPSVTGGTQASLSSPFNGDSVLHLLAETSSTSLSSSTSNYSVSSSTSSVSSSKKTVVATPKLTPNGGSYGGNVTVQITVDTPGATIYFTTDGTNPSQSSSKYSAPIGVHPTTMVKAKAFKNSSDPSQVASAWYLEASGFDFSLANPGNVSVTAGSAISNSIDANLISGTSQSVAFSVTGVPSGSTGSFTSASCAPQCSTTLNIATSSATPAGNYVITVSASGGGLTRTTSFTLSVGTAISGTVATPTITPNGGSFASLVSVSMATATSGASIYYTTNGSSPTQSSTPYTGAITLTSGGVVKAKAFKSGYNASAEASASFTQAFTSTTNTGLVAYWNFNEGAGTTAADSSGNGNTGILTNGPSWAAGISGNALYFDGIDDNVTVMDSTSLDISGAFTLSAWVKPDATFTDGRTILAKNYTYYLYASIPGYCGDGSPLGGFEVDINRTVCQPLPLAANTWAHLALTYDGSSLTLYRDGIAVATSNVSGTIVTSPGTLQIGANQYGEYFQGAIDEVSVYNRTLSAIEIQALYQQVAVNLPFNYTISNSGDQSLTAGSSITNTISATLFSGGAQAVTFSVSGLPSGASASFSSGSCTLSCSTVLTIITTGSTPAGSYPITVTSAGGGLKRSTIFNLSVTLVLTVATPTISPNGGSFSNSVSVTMGSATSGSSIYYTTDGSLPTQSSTLYTGAMSLTSNATVKAAAFKSGYNPSTVAAASFTNSSTSATGAQLYVATTGNDTTGDGSSGSPWRTIQKCVNTATAGKTCNVAAGTYYERVNAVNSGTAGNPITIKGAGITTIVDGSDDHASGWVTAPEIGSGVYKKSLGFEPFAMTYDGTKHAYRVHSDYMNGNSNIEGVTGQAALAFSSSKTEARFGCPSVNWWDALGGVIFGYDSRNGTTYVRFKDGSTPASHSVRMARGTAQAPSLPPIDAVFEINGKSYVTISNFKIQGHRVGVSVSSDSATLAQNNIIENNTITVLGDRIYISTNAHGTIIRNNTLQWATGHTTTMGAWEVNCDSTTKSAASLNYLWTKWFFGNQLLENASSAIRIDAWNPDSITGTDISGNTLQDGVVGFTTEGYPGSPVTKFHGNTIRNFAAQGFFPGGQHSVEFYDNIIANVNNGIRGNIWANSGGTGSLWIYRNKFWSPQGTGLGGIYLDNCCLSAGTQRNIFIYHNSISGFFNAMRFSDFQTSSCVNCLVLNNVFNSTHSLLISDTPNFCETDEKVDVYDYNFHIPNENSSCLWYGPNNKNSSTPVWSLGSEPSNWSLPGGHVARNAGINIANPFTADGTNYSPLPGFSPGYFSGAAPNMGAVQ